MRSRAAGCCTSWWTGRWCSSDGQVGDGAGDEGQLVLHGLVRDFVERELGAGGWPRRTPPFCMPIAPVLRPASGGRTTTGICTII